MFIKDGETVDVKIYYKKNKNRYIAATENEYKSYSQGGAAAHGVTEKLIWGSVVKAVGVSVDQARNENLPSGVNDLGSRPDRVACIRSHVGDPFPFDGHGISFEEFAAVNIGQIGILDDQVGFFLTQGNGSERPHILRIQCAHHFFLTAF